MLVTLDFTSNCEKTNGFCLRFQSLELSLNVWSLAGVVICDCKGLVANRPTLYFDLQLGRWGPRRPWGCAPPGHRRSLTWRRSAPRRHARCATRGVTRDDLDDLDDSSYEKPVFRDVKNIYEYDMNILRICFEYFMNIMNDLMEKETQLHNICNCCLWFVAFWLHAFAGRVAKDSVGGKWKGLRCVHHRLRWPWTKIHWTNFSWNFEFSQSWINLWVSIVRSGRFNGQFGEFCVTDILSWVLSPQMNWPSISDAVKISALPWEMQDVFSYHSISFLSWWMNFSPSQILAFARFLPCLHFAQPFVQATRVLYRQGKFVVGTSVWDNKPDSLSLPAPLPANHWTVTKGHLSQLSFKFFETKWSQVSQVVQTLDFEIFFVEVPPTCCSWLRTWRHAEEPDVRNAHVAAMFAKGTEGNGNCACFSHPRLGDSLVEEPYSMILGRLNSLGLIVVGLNWAEAPTLPFDHCRKTVSKFQKTFPGPAFSCCKHISK